MILSFVWLSIYPAISSLTFSFEFGYGNILSKNVLPSVALQVLFKALSSWIIFELIFYIYRFFLQFKIYSFIVPAGSLKAESRIFFIYRNIFLGVLYNLCFIFPYLTELLMVFNLIVTMVTLVIYANHLNKIYSEPIVGHFVFKNFCLPVFVFEAIVIGLSVLEVVL